MLLYTTLYTILNSSHNFRTEIKYSITYSTYIYATYPPDGSKKLKQSKKSITKHESVTARGG